MPAKPALLRQAGQRIDLRNLPFVTIDGEDAKDYDDAVYCQRHHGKGWTLYVAIADVSHYISVDTALDQEAQQRGNSVYFPGHVIPMLPEDLSNGLCSLKPREDRLVMVVKWTSIVMATSLVINFVKALSIPMPGLPIPKWPLC